jgi:diguanylate cyclase (GGDEF)-like protein
LPLWNRKLLNSYWIIIGLSISLSIIHNGISYFTNQYDTIPIIMLGILWILSMSALEATNYWMKKWNDYLIITGAFIIPISLIYSFPENSVLLTTLYLPILISVLYFQFRKVIYSTVLSLVSFYTLYTLCLADTALYSRNDLFIMTGVLLFGAIVALGIMSRGSELLKHLQTSVASGQDLLVKNVIMDKQIKTDALTGLYNHMSFHEYLDKLIEQGEKYNLSFQLAVLDIDHFKKVNDTFGHRAGDAVLKKVAHTITSLVSPNDFTARYGGEEFAIIFTDIELNESLINLENIRTTIEKLHHEELMGNAVTISIGVQDYARGCTKEALFTGADQALYEAKRNGRNQMVVHEPQKETTDSQL